MKKKFLIGFIIIIILIFMLFVFDIFSFKEKESLIITLDKNEFFSGETINFNIKTLIEKGTYTKCIGSNTISYSILDENKNHIDTTYKCSGLAGSVINRYCNNGVVEEVYLPIHCSDTINCNKIDVNKTYYSDKNYSWDQTEIKTISEDCNGIKISRQEKEQVEKGLYYIKTKTINTEPIVNADKSFLIK